MPKAATLFLPVLIFVLLASFAETKTFAQETKTQEVPRFVIGPPGKTELAAYRQLIEKPEAWAKLRPHVGALLFASHWLNEQYPEDGQLRAAMKALRKMDMPIELEVGALKEWAKTGEATYRAQTKDWNRIIDCGGDLRSFAMDEPFINAREHMKIEKDKAMEFAAEETAVFMELVRKNYPDILIGDIEGFPYLSADELIRFIDLLQAKLKARGVRGLDFFRVDTNWMNFVVRNMDGDWHDLKRVELHCRKLGIPFSVIYWASNFPAAARAGIGDDKTWYVGTMQMGYDYALTGGTPDQFVIESWVGVPEKTLPDSDPFSFTGGALDFAERFVVKNNEKQ